MTYNYIHLTYACLGARWALIITYLCVATSQVRDDRHMCVNCNSEW
jgi:hypothetical protein